MAAPKNYTTALAKGHGIIEETLALLEIWKPGMNAQQLAEIAIRLYCEVPELIPVYSDAAQSPY